MKKFWLAVGIAIAIVAMYGVFVMLLIKLLASSFGIEANLDIFNRVD